MKKNYIKFPVLIAVFFLTINSLLFSQTTIYSTAAGGPWDSTWTWVGGVVPTSAYNAVINGTVYSSNDACHNLTINPGGTLTAMGWYYTLNVGGDVTNNGTISNGTYPFTLYITGNITNNGEWTNSYTNLTGSSSHDISCQNGHFFNGSEFNNTGSGNTIINDQAYFSNVAVNMNNNSITISDNAVLRMFSGYLYQCSVTGAGAGSVIYGEGEWDNGAPYFQKVNFTDLAFQGSINIHSDCSTYGLITNEANLQSALWYYTLTINGDLVNDGVIQNSTYPFYLKLYGDIVNNGVLDNKELQFYGSTDQSMTELNGNVFSCEYLHSYKPSGKLKMLTDIDFKDCGINMHGDTIECLNNGKLRVDGAYLYDAVVTAGDTKNGNLIMEMTAASYLEKCQVYNPEILGKVNIDSDNIFYGTTTVTDTLQSHYWYHTLVVYGEIINKGIIQNSTYPFYLKLYGDIVNNGVLVNKELQFYGLTDQSMTELNGNVFNCEYLHSYKPSGKLKMLTDIDFKDCGINMHGDTIECLNNGKLRVDGAYLFDAVVTAGNAKNGNLKLEMTAATYLKNCHVYNPEILGLVNINYDNVFYGTTTVTDTLQSHYWNHTLTVYGEIINNGIIQNSTYPLYLKLYGDIVNNGVLDNKELQFYGSTDQSMTELNGNVFNCEYLHSYKPSGKLKMLSDIDFKDCGINMHGDTIECLNNGKLRVDGAYLYDAVVTAGDTKNGNLKLEMTAASYLEKCQLYNPEILGKVNIHNNENVFYGTTTITDTLQNNNWYYTLTVQGEVINNGIIQNYNYPLYLKLYGDIVNNGVLINSELQFYDSINQNISELNGHPFNCAIFRSYKPSGKIIALTDIDFKNCNVNMDNDTLLIVNNGKVNLDGGYLLNTVLLADDSKNGNLKLEMNESSHLDNCHIFNPEILGVVNVYGNYNVFYGLIKNNGIIQNYNWYYTLNVEGSVVNNGVIRNYNYPFTVNINENITNNGSWFNSTTNLTGTTDQTVTIENGKIIQCHLKFVSDVQTSPYQWYKDSNPISYNDPLFSGSTGTTLTLTKSLTSSYDGTYFCSTGGGNSRNIIVNNQSNSCFIYAYLEGPYNGLDMNTTLNSKGLIPYEQPFNTAPWNYDGKEAVPGIPGPSVIDWVLLEFRDASDAASATSGTVIARKAGLLMNNGEIVDIDGYSRLSFGGTITQNLFVVVYHRNHLGIMSATPLTYTGSYYYYDFSLNVDQAYQSGQKIVGQKAVMYAGDANGNGTIGSDDATVWQAETGNAGYLQSDANLDGQSDNKDKNDIWVNNFGTSMTVPN